MKKWQIENSETSEILQISEILFRVFLFASFWFCPIAKIENSDLKISEKNLLVFRVFDLAYSEPVLSFRTTNVLLYPLIKIWATHYSFFIHFLVYKLLKGS